MKTKIKFLATMLMGIMLSTNVWGEATTDTWDLVTEVASLSANDIVILVSADYNSALSTNQASNNRTRAIVTKQNNNANLTFDENAGVCKLKLETGIVDGSFAFYDVTNAVYLYVSSSAGSNNRLWSQEELDQNASFIITIDGSSHKARIVCQGQGVTRTDLAFGCTNAQTGEGVFSCQATTKQNLYIYKKAATCTQDLATPVVTATPGNGSATLTWATVANATKYQVSWNDGAYVDATSPHEETDLTNDTEYTWKVKAIGGGDYCDSEDATGNVTPSANHTVTWYVDGFVYTTGSPTTEVVHGGTVATLPAQPDVPTACAGSVFVGWTDHAVTNGNKPSPLFKDAASAPTVNANVNYHAVFADPE